MSSVGKPLSVKWNGKLLDNLQGAEGEEVVNLKRSIEACYGIPLKKQKLLYKGKFLKDEDLIDGKMLESGQTIMLMGTAEATDINAHLNAAASSLNEADKSSVSEEKTISAVGLKNLGNTCYVNSAVQVLSGLHGKFSIFNPLSDSEPVKLEPLSDSFLGLLKNLREPRDSLTPLDFILKLRSRFSEYAEKNSYGIYIQHDVHEFWTNLWAFFSGQFNFPKDSSLLLERRTNDGTCDFESVGCVLLPVTSETSFLEDSLKLAFSERAADGNQVNLRISFSNLPQFIPFVFMRFMWKTSEKVQAKILKLVAYPKTFDILNYSNEEMKRVISEKRVKVANYGIYRLQYVITHTGREADSGHYMAWSKIDEENKSEKAAYDNWLKFDDDLVTAVKEDEVMKLGGSGDRPTAYMVYYIKTWNVSE